MNVTDLTVGVLNLVGRLGSPRDQLWFVPAWRAARSVLVGSGLFTLTLILSLFWHGGSWLILGLMCALLIAALWRRSWPEWVLGVVLFAAPWLINLLWPSRAIVLLVVWPLIAFWALRFMLTKRNLGWMDRHWPALRSQLTDWQAYLPKDTQAAQVARVLVSPAGETFFLGLVRGRTEMKYGQEHVVWNGVTVQTVRDLASRDVGAVQSGQHVLWVAQPANAQGEYAPSLDGSVSTVIATVTGLAAQLQNWSAMRANLGSPAAVAADVGQQTEAQAIDDLQAVLTVGWTLRRNVLLSSGGDADLEVTAPSGVRYVVEIKSRTDKMDLDAPRSGRAVSWQEIHQQVTQAAQQLQGVAVIWQPRTRDEELDWVDGVWCQRGDAPALMETLLDIEVLDAREQAAEKQAASPHEVLGISPGASREEIRAAYKNLVKKYHPDRLASLGEEFHAIAERKMKLINAAYEALMD